MKITKSTYKAGILSTIGSTPMVELKNLYPDANINVHAKLEAFNPGGSIKDRTAFNILNEAFNTGNLKKGDTIIESSSGNMAVGLAQACLYFGLKLIVVVDPLINCHTLKILETYGAQIEMVTQEENGSFLNARLACVQRLLKETKNSFWPNQYTNQANPEAHLQTMQEIVTQLHGKVDYLFAATSTCGTIMGCANYIKKLGLSTQLVAVDAVGSVIFNGSSSKRLIPGHGAGRASQLLKPEMIDHVVHVSDKETVIGCHHLLNNEAILAGGSSGAVTMAVHKLLPNIPEGSNCVMVLCDRGERYLNTIYSKHWIRENFGKLDLNLAKPLAVYQ